MWAPGKGGSGGSDATAAAAAYRLPAAAPSSQISQVCRLFSLSNHSFHLAACTYEFSGHVKWGEGAAQIGFTVLRISASLLRGGDQNLLPTMNRSLSVPDSGSLWDLHTSASSQSGVWPAQQSLGGVGRPGAMPSLLGVCFSPRGLSFLLQLPLPPAGGEASLWDIPINSSTQGPILEQLQLQHKVSRHPGAGALTEAGKARRPHV